MSKLAAIRRGRSVRAKISAEKGRPWGIFFSFYKTRHILLSYSANCTVLRAVVLAQYRRVTDGRTEGQTDGIAIASKLTALAMRTLRRAVNTIPNIAHRSVVIRLKFGKLFVTFIANLLLTLTVKDCTKSIRIS